MFGLVAIDLYVVHGSHPCAAVERALELKGLAYRRIELPPPQRQVWIKELPALPANEWPRRDAAE